jgi:pimeloyl-ACP methyl ester carboxylesterase
LTESARLASGDADLVLPERFVLAGHSAGGLLAAGAAGFYSADALANNTPNDLAGVLLLDTSPVGGGLARGLAKIPDNIPVYTISAQPGPLDSYGGANDVLEAARPGQFVGVQLVGGAHADAAQTGNPLVQLFSQLAGLGFSQPQNVQAVQDLGLDDRHPRHRWHRRGLRPACAPRS